MNTCNSETGVCELPADAATPSATTAATAPHTGWSVHYVGDPMCSWCWGISPTVEAMAAHCEAHGLGFTVTVGGLRAGGGDPWNAPFKQFLRHEWQKIAQVTGQPFGFTLLDWPHFEYDTEPACRAVVTVQLLQARLGACRTWGVDGESRPQRGQFLPDSKAHGPAMGQEDGEKWTAAVDLQPTHPKSDRLLGLPARLPLRFFAAVQQRFYVEGQDPKLTAFYEPICQALGLDFAVFATLFESAEAHQATQAAFARCRQWGVRSFPTLLVEHQGQLGLLASGHVTQTQLLERLAQFQALTPKSIA